MDELTDGFEAHRPRLRSIAVRMLGSDLEADDVVQETWLRLARTEPGTVDNLGGWLTTVLGRICLDHLRARTTRREDPWQSPDDLEFPRHRAPAGSPGPSGDGDPEREALVAEAVGQAVQTVLDTLAPAERVAFVLHDLFAVPFDAIATLLDRSPAATRQLASRARRRVQGAGRGEPPRPSAEHSDQRHVVAAFLAASRAGDLAGLVALLDPSVVLRADATVVGFGAAAETRGVREVAETFSGRAQAATLATVDGRPGAAWLADGSPRVVFDFTVVDGRVVAIDLLADPDTLAVIELTS